MTRLALLLTVVVASGLTLAAQQPAPTFDVASIKSTRLDLPYETAEQSAWMGFSRGRYQLGVPGRFSEQAIPLIALMQLAYDVWAYQIVGGPGWVRSSRFSIDARASGSATLVQMRPMFRALLEHRFKLMVHRETRTLPVYELVAVNRGSKLVAAKDGECLRLGPDSPLPPISLPPAPMPNICGCSPSTWKRRTNW